MRGTGERKTTVVLGKRPPHPNPPPQGGRGQEGATPESNLNLPASACYPLPPCGGGLGWGASFAILYASLFAPTSLRADEIPVVGRPAEHFYGAAGERLTVTAELSSAEVRADGEVTWTLRVAGLLNAKDVKRPDLRQLPAFHDRFHVADDPDPARVAPGERVFVYRLRPRSAGVTAVPEFLFRHYKPSARAENTDPRRWFPLRSTSELPVRVLPARDPDPPAPVPLDVPDFARTLADGGSEPSISSTWLILMFCAPPAAFLAWRRYGPDSDRAARHHRTRAARHALASLHRRQPPHSVVIAYLSQRFPLPPAARTPAEVRRSLDAAGAPLADRVGEFLGRCDAVRFGGADADLTPMAERLILDLEGVT